MVIKKYTLKDYELFKHEGQWVALRTGPDGVRRNIAPIWCKTKKRAIEYSRFDRDNINKGGPGIRGYTWILELQKSTKNDSH